MKLSKSYARFLKKLRYRPTELTNVYKEALKNSVVTDHKRPIRLRASSLPMCSVTTLESMLVDAYETDAAMMDYYCSVGTTVHTHLQKWMGKSGKIFGDWKCNNPKCKHQVKNSVKHKCPKCKAPMEYVELEVEHNIFSGHIDGLLKLPNKKFIVFDYKTTSMQNIYSKKYIPVAKHLMQIAAYGAILRKQGMDIDSLSVVYVARDNPAQVAEFNIPFTDELYEHTLEFLRQQIKGFKAALKSKETGNPATALKYKLCESYHDYKEEHEQFLGMDGCHLSTICFNNHAITDYLSALV